MLNEFNKYLMEYYGSKRVNIESLIDKRLISLKNINRILGAAIVFILYKFYQFLKNRKNKIQALLYVLPYIKIKIKNKLRKQSISLEKSTLSNNYKNFIELPEDKTEEDVLNTKLSVFSQYELSDRKTQVSGILYSINHYDDLSNKYYTRYSKTNPLHSDMYPQIRNMEVDIINVCKSLYKCPGVGSLTSGGTESLLLTCLAYRDHDLENKNITNPNIVGFETIHPAFDKACHYFNIKLRRCKDLRGIRRNIDSNTICIVGSAPDYPFGLIDPIEELNELAKSYKVNFHIDACMGGFLIPFIDDYAWINFDLDGLTSISMDSHKYGYAPKGSSILLFRDHKFKKYQHFIQKDWCGGVYATPTMLGSKPGGIIAGTWASLFLRGRKEFETISRSIRDNLIYLKDNVKYLDNLEVIGNPDLNIIAIKSDTIDIYQVVNLMKKKGWALTVMQNPPAFHFCLTTLHNRDTCFKFIGDLDKASREVSKKGNKKLEGTLALYGADNNLEKGLFIDEIIHDFIYLLSQNHISYRY